MVALAGWASQRQPLLIPLAQSRPSPAIAPVDRPARVRLGALAGQPSAVDVGGRNPFSIRQKAAVLILPSQRVPEIDRARLEQAAPVPTAITAPFKFMGILQKRTGETWGVFADCAGYTRAAREGESVLGIWRVLRVGAESAFVESLDGQRVTMPLGGCGPRS